MSSASSEVLADVVQASELDALVQSLRQGRGFTHKRDIGTVLDALAAALPGGSAAMAQAVAVGDDCAALPDPSGAGYLLFAIEGFIAEFVQAMPWFAGWSAVMVNLSDIAAMGGRPLAIVNALWSNGSEPARTVLQGMAAASQAYGVPIVGGHSNLQSGSAQLAAAVLGRAERLLSSFSARAGDVLFMAVDLRGAYEEPQPFWNAATHAPPERLRGDLALLPELAESGLADTAKDISMAGVLGTALMLLECSRVGAVVDLDAVPRPPNVPLLRWLQSFPSYGYLLSLRPADVPLVQARFAARGIASAAIGQVTTTPQLWVRQRDAKALLWDLARESFIGGEQGLPRG